MKVIGSEELEKKEGRDLVFGKRKEKKKKKREIERERKRAENEGKSWGRRELGSDIDVEGSAYN